MMIQEIDGKKYLDNEVKIFMQNCENTKLIAALHNVNLNDTVDSSGIKMLHLSIKYKNIFLTKFLIQRGVEIDPTDDNGETPLIMALKYKHMEQVELLVVANASIHSTDISGKSALTMVFQLRHRGAELEIIKLFLMKLAVNCSNDEELAKTLIHAGCSLDKVIYLNNPSLIIKMLEYGYTVDTKHRYNSGNTALHVAATLSYSDIIKVLLQHGADISVVNKRGHIPLIHGIIYQSKQDPNVMEALMPQDFDWINSNIETDIPDRLPLYYIFTKGTKETLRLFQSRYNINLSATDLYGETPLHYLMTNNNEGILEPFRHAKFDVNAQDSCIQTSALHMAAMSGAPDSVIFLLERGAETDSKDLFGRTPLLHVFSAITNHDIAMDDSLRMNNLAECVELLMLHGADPEVISTFAFGTALDWATYFQIYSLTKSVLAHFAILEHSGTPLTERTREKIHSNDQLKSYFELCKQQLEQTKTHFLHDRVTVYKILTESEDKIALYTRRQDKTDKIISVTFQLESYYWKLLKKRLYDATKINNLKDNAALLLSDMIGLLDPNHLVIDKIICYLSKYDLKELIL